MSYKIPKTPPLGPKGSHISLGANVPLASNMLAGGNSINKTPKTSLPNSLTATPYPQRAADQALLDAAEQGSLDAVRALVDSHKGDIAYINGNDRMGTTALHCAAMGSHLDVCAYLLREGADATVANKEGTTPVHYIVRKPPKLASQEDSSPRAVFSLLDALNQGKQSMYSKVLELMVEKGASIDAQSIRGETPLHQAAARSNDVAIKWLLAHGADVKKTNTFGETPLKSLKNQESLTATLLESASGDASVSTIPELYTWGYGPYGQLGYQTNTGEKYQMTPRKMELKQTFVDVICGNYTSAALTQAGELFMWGRGNSPSQLSASCPLLGNGKIEDVFVPAMITGLPKIIQVSLGVYHAAAVSEKGELFTWGYGGSGQLGHGNKENQPAPLPLTRLAKNRVVHVAAADTHTVCITDDGKLYTWGLCEYGQLGHGDVSERLLPTKVQALDSMFVKHAAVAVSHTAVVAAVSSTSYVDSSVYTFGVMSTSQYTPQTTPLHMPNLNDKGIRMVACGSYVTAALSETGDIYTWGTGRQLGHPDSNSEPTPKLIESFKDKSVRYISCGATHLIATTDRGHMYSVGKDSFGQCGNGKGDQATPTRIGAPGIFQRVSRVSCGDKHSACIIDAKRSVADKQAWHILETQRSLVRAITTIIDCYQNPLRAANVPASPGEKPELRKFARVLTSASGPASYFVLDADVNAIFGKIEPLFRASSLLLERLDAKMASLNRGDVSGISELFLNYLDNKAYVNYFNSLSDSISTVERVVDNSPQFQAFLSEARRNAELTRKTEPYEEELRDMSLQALMLEPYFLMQHIQGCLTAWAGAVKEGSAEHSTLESIIAANGRAILGFRDVMISQESAPGKVVTIRALNSAFDSLQEFRNLCKALAKSGKKMAAIEVELASERSSFGDVITQLRVLDPMDVKAVPALEMYSESVKKLSTQGHQASNHIIKNFVSPMNKLVSDLDDILTGLAPQKKAVEDNYHEYTTHLTKTLHAAKLQKADPRKQSDFERELASKKKTFETLSTELSQKVRSTQAQKRRALTHIFRAMRGDLDRFQRASDRMALMRPQIDQLEIILRSQARKEWGAQLAASVYAELALLSAEYASDTDSTILAPLLPKLNEPVQLQNAGYAPLVDMLALPNMVFLNAFTLSAVDEQDKESVTRNIVRALDAFNLAIPLIRRGISTEVENTQDPGTLFRQNTVLTKLMTAYTKLTGATYLTRNIKPIVIDILTTASTTSYEPDINKAKEGENIEQNLNRLMDVSQRILDAVFRAGVDFPLSLRVLAGSLMRDVQKKFPTHRLTSVGGFLFLRFICPAILSPGAYGMLDTNANDASRPLILISKMLQNLSNGIEFGSKEAYMIGANKFITDNLDKVRTFFEQVATIPPNSVPASVASMQDVDPDLHAIHLAYAKNFTKIIKSLSSYRHKEFIPKVWLELVDLGDPCVVDEH